MSSRQDGYVHQGLLASLCLALTITGASAADVTLVQDGQARCANFVTPEVMADDKPVAGIKFPEAESERQRLRVEAPEYSGCGFGYLPPLFPERMRQARALMFRALARAKPTP